MHHDTLAAPAAAAAPGRAPRRAACAPDMLLPDAGPEPGDQPGLPEAAGHGALGESARPGPGASVQTQAPEFALG